MLRNFNTRKSLFVTVALGLAALGSTTMPAAAWPGVSSQFIRTSPMGLPHMGGPVVSNVIGGNPVARVGERTPAPLPVDSYSTKPGGVTPKGPQPTTTGAVSTKPDGVFEKKPQMPDPYPQANTKPGSNGGCEKKLGGPCILPNIGGGSSSGGSTGSGSASSGGSTGGGSTGGGSTGGGSTGGGGTSTSGPNISIHMPPVVIPSQPVYYPQQPVAGRQPVYADRSQVAAAQPQQPMVQPAGANAAQEPAGCLTKQYLNDGSVLFKDICTMEAAIATEVQAKALAQAALQ
jgi:hypothetical protein